MRVPLSPPAGIHGDDTTFASQGRWADINCMRFYQGRAQVIGGWESLTLSLLTGVCRSAFPMTDNSNNLTLGFGTHSKLQLWQGGGLYDVTPTLALPSLALGAIPLTTSTGTPTVVVAQNGHPYIVGDVIALAGVVAVGGITPTGNVTVTAAATNTWTFAWTSNATSTATGGGSAVIVTPQRALAVGQVDGTGSTGYGTGSYGGGVFGISTDGAYYPRTWSFGAWGQNMLASPRGGTIFSWTNDTSVVAAPLANAPAQVSYMMVAPNSGGYQVFALGCNQEASGIFSPMCVRHSSVRVNTEWNTGPATTAREYILVGGGRIVAGAMAGPYILIWTSDSLFLGDFVGDLNQPWKFTRVGQHCGLLGPNAKTVDGQTAYWISPDLQFHSYSLGGEPKVIPCEVREDFAANLAASQGDKVTASTNAKYSEVRWDYPDARDGAGLENSRYISVCVSGPDVGAWSRGIMARTAFTDAGPGQFPVGVTVDGHVYFHEKNNSADGSAFAWSITTADCYIDENVTMSVDGIWPDIFHQQGPVYCEVFARFFPQDTETTTGALTLGVGAQKVDFRASGRLFRVKFSGNSGPTYARLGKFDFSVGKGGLR